MSLSKREIYKKLIDEYKTIKFNLEIELDRRKSHIYSSIPRIKVIDNQLFDIGLNLSKEILNGNNNTKDIISDLNKKTIDLKIEKGELLSKNGFPPDYLTIRYNCTSCKDTGFIDGKECSCFKKRLIQLAYEKSNLSTLLYSQTFDNFLFTYYSDKVDDNMGISPLDNMRDIYKNCIDFVKNFDTVDINIIMYGPAGLGKTFLSSCIAQELLNKGKTVFYQTAYNIFEIIENYKFNKEPDSQYIIKEQVDSLYEVDLLIIDDLGTEFFSSFTNAAFFNIINTRMLNRKKTILNTNLTIEQIKNIYSDRVISRIIDKYILLKFFGEDIRKLKMKN